MGKQDSAKEKKIIPKLMREDLVVTSQEDKQNVIFDNFDGLLGSALPRAYTLDLNFFHREGVDLSALDAAISDEEVWDTIKSLPADRAPGPDGYTGRFFKSCWQLIKADFTAAGRCKEIMAS